MRPTLALLVLLSLSCASPSLEPEAEAGSPQARLVVISPSAAEMLAEFGLTERIVGVGDFVFRPVELTALPRVGSYNRPNVEQILELQCNVLITVRSDAARASNQRLRQLGVEVLELDTSQWAGTRQALLALGQRFDREGEARRTLQSLDQALDRVRRMAESSPRPGVLMVVGRDPLYVAGPGSHLDALILAAGGRNVAADSSSPYQLMSMEAMLQRLPDVIIDTSDNGPDAIRGRRAGPWETWDFLPAVRNNQVFWVDPDRLVIPGIRLPAMAERMGRFLHPEVFGEPLAADYEPEPAEMTIEEIP